MIKKIITVCGPIAPEEMGITSMHDHVLCDGTAFRERWANFIPPGTPVREEAPLGLKNLGYLKHFCILSSDNLRLTDVEIMSEEVSYFKASGGTAIVEMSVPGLRCDIQGIKTVSENTGVHIIAPTGVYTYDTWPETFKDMDTHDLTAFMLDEAENSIQASGIFPGHIKVALDTDDQPRELCAIKAGARVSLETGLPLTVHQGMTLSKDQGMKIANTVKNEGADLSRTIMAHCSQYFTEQTLTKAILDPDSRKLNTDHAKKLLDRGLTISIDLFGHTWDAEPLGLLNPADWQEMAGLVALIKEGYSRQIVLGTDTFLKFNLRNFGGDGYCRLTDFVIPTLEGIGVSDPDIRAMTIDNPVRLLSL